MSYLSRNLSSPGLFSPPEILVIALTCHLQDAAFGVLHGPALGLETVDGPALVPGPASHPDLLPGERRMALPTDFRQNNRQRLAVSFRQVT